MKRSLNEVTNEYRKALVGAGYPVGVAQDGAMAAQCLQLAGFDSASAVLAALPGADDRELSASLPQLPALYECVLAGEDTAELSSVDVPMMALGTGLHLSREHDCVFSVELDGTDYEVAPWGISPDPIGALQADGAKTFIVRLNNSSVEAKAPLKLGHDGVEINEAIWPDIQRWSKETYVPASEQSRLAGAGAGLTDND